MVGPQVGCLGMLLAKRWGPWKVGLMGGGKGIVETRGGSWGSRDEI